MKACAATGSTRYECHCEPVLHVISGLMTGGAEKSLLATAVAVRELGIRSTVLTLRSGPIQGELRASNFVVNEIRPSRPWQFFRLRTALRSLPPAMRPKIVHGWMYHGSIAADAIARALSVPVLIGVRQSLGDGMHDKLLTKMVIRACGKASHRAAATIYNSGNAQREHIAAGFASLNSRVIPNGFVIDQFAPDASARARVRHRLGIPNDAFVIGHVGRLHGVKNQGLFVRAAGQTMCSSRDVHAVMVGKDVSWSEQRLAVQIADTGAGARFHLLDEQREMPELYCAMDVLCVTSWAESFPNVVGEAMSCGVSCIATDVGDVRDLIGDTGAIVPVGQSEPIVTALRALISTDQAARVGLGQRCRKRIEERFSIRAIARRYHNLYAELGVMRLA